MNKRIQLLHISKSQFPFFEIKKEQSDKISFPFPYTANKHIVLVLVFKSPWTLFCLIWRYFSDNPKYFVSVHVQIWYSKRTLKTLCFKGKDKMRCFITHKSFLKGKEEPGDMAETHGFCLDSISVLAQSSAISNWSRLGPAVPAFQAARPPRLANPSFTPQQYSPTTDVLSTSITLPVLLCTNAKLVIVGFQSLYQLLFPP